MRGQFVLVIRCVFVHFQTTDTLVSLSSEAHRPALQGIYALQDGPEIPGFDPAVVASEGGRIVVFAVFPSA